ncbi:MAG: cell division protein [Rikenellaceae bacterium]
MRLSIVITHILFKFKALLILGGAVMLVCCKGEGTVDPMANAKEHLLTELSRDMTINMSENGRPSYIFEAPLVEGYTMASDPYRKFREGIKITTFTNDSLNEVNGVLTGDYAIFYEKRDLWEVVGNVVVVKSDGKTLTSEQLFWNAQSKRIYSNVDTRIDDASTGDIYEGEGFESDEAMVVWSFRRLKGRMSVEEVAPAAQSPQAQGAGDMDDEDIDLFLGEQAVVVDTVALDETVVDSIAEVDREPMDALSELDELLDGAGLSE